MNCSSYLMLCNHFKALSSLKEHILITNIQSSRASLILYIFVQEFIKPEDCFTHPSGAWAEKTRKAGTGKAGLLGNLNLSLYCLSTWSCLPGGFTIPRLLKWQLRATKACALKEGMRK